MEQLWIERLDVRGVGCLSDVGVELTPLHAFIGPNDAGKSTMLRAVQAAVTSPSSEVVAVSNPWTDRQAAPYEILAEFCVSPFRYHFNHESGAFRGELFGSTGDHHQFSAGDWPGLGAALRNSTVKPSSPLVPLVEWIKKGARLIHWDVDALRKDSKLIPESDVVRLQDERGFGLPGVFDVIINRGDDAMGRLQERVRALFPTIQSVRLKNVSSDTKSLEVLLKSGERIPADSMSSGLLYYLAFAALEHIEPTSVLLVEEPENGLHPARVAEVMRIFREISNTTQVLIATHSPLVVNELNKNEVTVFTRDPEKGTTAVRLDKTPNFEDRSKVYALGELWLSYANGDDEGPLLSETEV